MPQWGSGNLKAQEARMRKQLEKEKKRREQEEKKLEELWKDDDKKVQAKLNRKMENEMKRQQKIEKKKELKQLYEEEDKKYNSNKESKSSKKVSQAEILRALIEEKKKQLEEEAKNKRIANASDIELEENINHIQRDEMENFDEYINVSGIDNAISALGNVSFEKTKKVKVAYKKYEEENLPILMQEHKGLKLSQYKQMLWKKFKKSGENPMNQRD